MVSTNRPKRTMNKKTIITALLAATFGLVSCNRDSN